MLYGTLPYIPFIPLAIWVGLIFFRGNFLQADQITSSPTAELETWPDVVAVIPARNEAPSIGAPVSSLLSQDYPGIRATLAPRILPVQRLERM